MVTFLALATQAQTATIQTFTDKTAFVAATGATSATGPLPDLGLVVPPALSVTVRSITFSLAPGGDNIAIGAVGTPAAPDWYVEGGVEGGNDGINELAMGFENLQAETTGPVFSFGFDFIEPNVTMPSFGGTPVDSTYEVLLFDGPALVGQATFSDIPDDVFTFLGVWSDMAFDRVLINDIAESPFVDDDEFFREFYTGATAYTPSGINGCIQLNGAPLVNAEVRKMQNGPKQTTTTDAAGCYQFPAVSGKKFRIQIQGPVVP
jgi:hypothetical protein